MRVSSLLAPIAVATTLAGCLPPSDETNDEPVTTAEAQQALEETVVATEATNLMGSTIEIGTSFTIGDAVDAAAAELRDFVQSQLPCAEVALEQNTLSITYGAHEGNCTYEGHTYSGTHAMTVSANQESQVIVEHAWTDLSNGKVTVTGDATVTWTLQDQLSRHVVHELTWTRISDGLTGTGTGDRMQTGLNGDVTQGLTIDGDRSWQGDAGTWALAIDDVQLRWIDPVPQSGLYTLTTPQNKEMSLGFERLDEDTITVTVASGDKSFSFDVTSF